MNAKQVVLFATGMLSLIIVALCFLFLYDSFSMPAERLGPIKDGFDLAVSRVLLPMFNTVVAVSLTYVFGKELVSALADRIRANSQRGPLPRKD